MHFLSNTKLKRHFFKLIKNLNSNKSAQQYDIPIEILKESNEICSHMLYCNFKNSMFSKGFPKSLKKANIAPIF